METSGQLHIPTDFSLPGRAPVMLDKMEQTYIQSKQGEEEKHPH
jgi:hypothetical protein